jgi:hypothetical protein
MFMFLNIILLIPRLGLGKMRDGVLLTFAHNIVSSLNGNASFPGVQADLLLVKAQADAFELAMGNVRNGPAGAAALKREERAKLEVMLKNLASKCVIEANGNQTVFLSSGFELRRSPHNYNELDTPTNFDVVTLASAGKVRVSFKRVPGAYSYELWAAKSGEGFKLHTMLTNGRKTVVNNLESLSIYRFRLRATGKNGMVSGYSEIVEVSVV